MLKLTPIFYFLFIVTLDTVSQTSVIPLASFWRYTGYGTNQSASWHAVTLQNGNWKTGCGKFGHGISDSGTVVSPGPYTSFASGGDRTTSIPVTIPAPAFITDTYAVARAIQEASGSDDDMSYDLELTENTTT